MKDFAKLCLPTMSVRNYTEAKTKYDGGKPGITTQWRGQHTPMRTHPVYYSFHQMADCHPTINQMNYLKPDLTKVKIDRFNLPEQYVVLQGAYTEIVKTMPATTFNTLKQYFLDSGLKVVCLGKTVNYTGYADIASKAKVDVNYDFNGTINLIDKTQLTESAKIIAGAKLFVGMDGGLVHLAGHTDVPIVAGFTFASPEHLMPIRNNEIGYKTYPIVPSEKLGCRFCQTKGVLYFDHDFRDCLYGPNDYTCTKQMDAGSFISQIEKALGRYENSFNL